MLRLILAFVLIAFAAPAAADDKSFFASNFDRVRVEGPFEVAIVVGGSSARVGAAGDPKMLDSLDVSVQGNTLIVRMGNRGWGEQGKVTGRTPVVSIVVPSLRGAAVVGGGRITVSGKLRSQRLDFQLSGNGSIDASGIDAEDVVVSLIGNGGITLAGKSLRARLQTNGNGTITAPALIVGDLLVRQDGAGVTTANARFTADVASTGLGSIVVTGAPKCRTAAVAGGPIQCGSQ